MRDNLKTLITSLPKVEPKVEFAQETAWQIIKNELVRLWEVKLSEVIALISVVLTILTVVHVYELVGILGTSDFWELVIKDKEWIADDFSSVWQAFIEAHPFKHLGILAVLIFCLVFSLNIYLKKNNKTEKLKSRNLLLYFIVLLLLITFLLSYLLLTS